MDCKDDLLTDNNMLVILQEEEKPLNIEVHENDHWKCKETESGRSKSFYGSLSGLFFCAIHWLKSSCCHMDFDKSIIKI